MARNYCQSCGKKNSYVGQQPSFCGFCGTSLAKSHAPASSTTRSKTIPRGSGLIKKTNEDIRDDESDVTEVPFIAKLEVDVDVGAIGMSKTYSVHELIGKPAEEKE